jgi:hypothetical protein
MPRAPGKGVPAVSPAKGGPVVRVLLIIVAEYDDRAAPASADAVSPDTRSPVSSAPVPTRSGPGSGAPPFMDPKYRGRRGRRPP